MVRILAIIGGAVIIVWAIRSMQRFYFYQKSSAVMLDGEEIDIEKLYFVVAMQVGLSEEELFKILPVFREEKVELVQEAEKENLNYKSAIAYFIVREAASIAKKASYSGDMNTSRRFEEITDKAFRFAESFKSS